MTYFQKIWDKELDFERRATLLSFYFTTQKTIKKYHTRNWKDLPAHFKTYLIRNSAQQMKEEE